MQSNQFILEIEKGLDSLGIYSVGFLIGSSMSLLTSGIKTAWYPYYMGFIKENINYEIIFGKILTYYVYLIGFICALYFLFAKPLIILFADSEYYQAYKVVGFVASAFFISTFYNFFLVGIFAKNEIQVQTLIQGLAAFFTIPLTFILIRLIGFQGACLGMLFGNLILALLMYFWNFLRRNIYPNIQYEWKRISFVVAINYSLIMLSSKFSFGNIFLQLLNSFVSSLILISLLLLTLKKNERNKAKYFLRNLLKLT